MTKLYKQLAPYYDLIYSQKDYENEAKYQQALIAKFKKSKSKKLLEVACGTGRYTKFYEKKFLTTGVDLNPAMLKIAKKRLTNTKLLAGDMRSFKLNEQFDVVLCLFSSIAYLTSTHNLIRVIKNFSEHLKPGGVIIISPWISKLQYKSNINFMDIYRSKQLKLARMSEHKVLNNTISKITHSWLIGENGKAVKIVTNDVHKSKLNNQAEYQAICKKLSLKCKYINRKPKTDRGLYVITKPMPS